MPNQANKAPSRAGVFLILCVAALGLGALTFYVQSTPEAKRVPEPLRRTEVTNVTPPAQKEKPIKTVKVFLPESFGEKVAFGQDAVEVPAGVKPETFVVNQTFEKFGLDGGKALGTELKGSILAIDCNRRLEEGVGSMQEESIIAALQIGLGQFKGVKGFNLYVEGRQVESLGHFELGNPTPTKSVGEN